MSISEADAYSHDVLEMRSGRTISFARDAGGMDMVDGSSWSMNRRDIAHANTARLNAVLQHVLKDGDTLILDAYNEKDDGGYFLFSGGVSNIVSK